MKLAVAIQLLDVKLELQKLTRSTRRAVQSDLDFLNSLSLNPTSTVSSASAPPTFELSPFSDLPTTATGELDLSALDEADVDDLLRRMDEAESAADGLEGQLDNLLGTLDGMLDVLGAGDDEVAPPEEEAKPNGKVVGVDESTEKEIVADGKDTKA
ncbi:hypothetical protein P7C70_g5469, partial [Phenoliferia sp. Uapishka_3]